MAGWIETFTERGGHLIICKTTVSDLEVLARAHELTWVATGKGELISLFQPFGLQCLLLRAGQDRRLVSRGERDMSQRL